MRYLDFVCTLQKQKYHRPVFPSLVLKASKGRRLLRLAQTFFFFFLREDSI